MNHDLKLSESKSLVLSEEDLQGSQHRKWWRTQTVKGRLLKQESESAPDMASATYTFDSCGRLTSVQYDDNSMVIYSFDSLGNRLMTYEIAGGGGDCCPPRFTLSQQNSNFVAEDAGTYYLISGGTLTVTMAPCLDIGEGNMMKFKVLSGQATMECDGSEMFNFANGSSAGSMVLLPTSGVLELTITSSGFDET